MSVTKPIKLASSLTKSRVFFCQLRWCGRRTCLRCKTRKLWVLKDERFRCSKCRYTFSDFTLTYLGRVRIPLNEVAHLAYEFSLGVPAYRMRFSTNSSTATNEKLFRTIRYAIYDEAIDTLRDLKLSGELEMDEAYFGGRRKRKKLRIKGLPQLWWGFEGNKKKQAVFGIYQRNGKVITFPVPNRRAKTLLPIVDKHTHRGSIYYTDENTAYATLSLRGQHVKVIKDIDTKIPKGEHTINGIEGFWSYAKIWLYHYRGVPKKYFPLYLKEVEYRFNHREEDLFPLMCKLLVNQVPDR